MRVLLTVLIACGFLFVPPVFADKPTGPAKIKQTKTHTQPYKSKPKSSVADADRMDLKAEEKHKEEKRQQQELADERPKGLEKQREKKAAQEQKELGKGSEQGQQSRENRKKWWKFWGDE